MRVYFWQKAAKALKKSRKTGKNTENVAGNQKTPFWSHGKLKKNLQKGGKGIFFMRKAGNRPYSRPSNSGFAGDPTSLARNNTII